MKVWGVWHHRDRDGGIDGVEEEETPEGHAILNRVVPLALPKRRDATLVEKGNHARERQQCEPDDWDE